MQKHEVITLKYYNIFWIMLINVLLRLKYKLLSWIWHCNRRYKVLFSETLVFLGSAPDIQVSSGLGYSVLFVLVFVIITLFQIIVGELTPKSIAN